MNKNRKSSKYPKNKSHARPEKNNSKTKNPEKKPKFTKREPMKIPGPFSKAVDQEAHKIASTSTQDMANEVANRRDFRGITTFTIDPVDAQDFDDALSYRLTPSDPRYGGVKTHEVGVHIADVTHYVKPDSAIDQEAQKRATSIYLVGRVIPMLPEILSNDICSLKQDVDRLTFSAVFILNDEGDILNEWFGRTIIHSNRRYSYGEVQEILDGKTGDHEEELRTLNRLATIIRKRNADLGSISFESEEVKFDLDENGWPTGVKIKKIEDANRLIEDFMLLANREVATFVSAKVKNRPHQFVYRVHDVPDMDKVVQLAEFLKPLGYDLKIKGGKIHQREINRLLTAAIGAAEEGFINQAAIRSMAKATYSTKNIGHYGLGFAHYTHFTSPIRRYPDMMVHRLLDLYLESKKPNQKMLNEYAALSIHSTDREIGAAGAERDSIKMMQVKYWSRHEGEESVGTITGVTEFGFFVAEEKTKADGLVSARSLTDDYYIFDEKNYSLVGRKTHRRFRLGDKVKIVITRADLERNLLDYQLLD